MYMYKNYNYKLYKKKKIQKILVFSPFCQSDQKGKKKELEIRGCTSSSAKRSRTRRVMVFKMNNP